MKKALVTIVHFMVTSNAFAISKCDLVNGDVQLAETKSNITTNIPTISGFAIYGPKVLQSSGDFVVPSLFSVHDKLLFWNRQIGNQTDAESMVRRALRVELQGLLNACAGDPAKIKAVREVMTNEIISFMVESFEMRRTEFLVQNPDPAQPIGVALPDGQGLLLTNPKVAALYKEWISEYKWSFPFAENPGS